MNLYKAHKKGSALLTLLILLPAIILFTLINLKNNHVGNLKIHQQTEADALILNYSAYQMDALNSIAAYNRAIEITANRSYMVAAALMLLRACAVATLFASPCTRYWAKLEKHAIPFFKKANTMMAYYAEQQDKIKSWAETAPYQHLALVNIKENLKQKSYYSLSPKKSDFALPIVRDKNRNLKKDNPLYQNQDFKKCHNRTEKSLIRLNSFIGTYKYKKDMTIDVYYRNHNNGSRKKVRYTSFLKIEAIPKYISSNNSKQRLGFSYAHISKCQKFSTFMDKLSKLALRVKVPPFYVFKPDYLQKGLKLKLSSRKHHKNKSFVTIKKLSSSKLKQPSFISVQSTACISGNTLFKMNFNATLCSES